MFMRRRPLARAAMVGGVGYAGYRAGQNRQVSNEREADQQARLDALEAQQYAAAPAPAVAAAAPAGKSTVDQLKELAELKQAGILTDAEFEVQKQKILQGM